MKFLKATIELRNEVGFLGENRLLDFLDFLTLYRFRKPRFFSQNLFWLGLWGHMVVFLHQKFELRKIFKLGHVLKSPVERSLEFMEQLFVEVNLVRDSVFLIVKNILVITELVQTAKGRNVLFVQLFFLLRALVRRRFSVHTHRASQILSLLRAKFLGSGIVDALPDFGRCPIFHRHFPTA